MLNTVLYNSQISRYCHSTSVWCSFRFAAAKMYALSATVTILGLIAVSCAQTTCDYDDDQVTTCTVGLVINVTVVGTEACDALDNFYTCVRSQCTNAEETIAELFIKGGDAYVQNECPACAGNRYGVTTDGSTFQCEESCPANRTDGINAPFDADNCLYWDFSITPSGALGFSPCTFLILIAAAATAALLRTQ